MTARTIRRLRTGWHGYGRWLAAAAVGFAALQFVTAGAVSGAPGDVIGYPVPSRDSNLSGITTGPDRNLWFTEYSTQVIGRITPAGQITELHVGIAANAITTGPDGNLWFTEPDANKIGRMTTGGAITEFSDGIAPGGRPGSIAAGPDGNLWFTDYTGDRIGRITPTGQIHEFSDGITPGSGPAWITVGPDGNLWFSEQTGNRIGRITPTGQVDEFSDGMTPGSVPNGITAGPDGNVWFAEEGGARIGRITPTGQIHEFHDGITAPTFDIAAGPDGVLWFTEYYGNHVGSITPTGTAGEPPNSIPANSGLLRITAGPDGNMWFLEREANQIGRLELAPSGPIVSINPDSYHFPAQRVGTTSAPVEYTVSNTGTGPLAIDQVSLGGTRPEQFGIVSDHCSGTSVAAGSNCTLGVTFHPTELGSPTAIVSVASNATSGSNSATLTGFATAPAATIAPASHDFGNQPVGSSTNVEQFDVSNTGTAPLTVTGVNVSGANAGDFPVDTEGCTAQPVTPTNHCTIRVHFTPTAAGARSAMLTVTDDASGSPHTVTLTGTGTAPAVSIAPASHDFSDEAVGSTSPPVQFTVTNTGNAPLVIGSTSKGGTNPGDFAVTADTCAGATVAPAATCQVSATFTPTQVGDRAAQLLIVEAGHSHTVALTGTGTPPPAPAASIAPAGHNFGQQDVGNTSDLQQFTVTNTGGAPLSVDSVSIDGHDFAMSADECSAATVAPNASCTVGVTFTPAHAGLRSATLTVTDDASGSPHTVALTGTGTVASTPSTAPPSSSPPPASHNPNPVGGSGAPNPASEAGQKSGGLAFTGTPLGLLTAAGLALIAVGAALTLQRRRRS